MKLMLGAVALFLALVSAALAGDHVSRSPPPGQDLTASAAPIPQPDGMLHGPFLAASGSHGYLVDGAGNRLSEAGARCFLVFVDDRGPNGDQTPWYNLYLNDGAWALHVRGAPDNRAEARCFIPYPKEAAAPLLLDLPETFFMDGHMRRNEWKHATVSLKNSSLRYLVKLGEEYCQDYDMRPVWYWSAKVGFFNLVEPRLGYVDLVDRQGERLPEGLHVAHKVQCRS